MIFPIAKKAINTHIKSRKMAMNNWGGVKEHMSKKPRQLFNRKSFNKITKKNYRQPLSTEKLKKADKIRKARIRKNIFIYLIIIFVLSALIVYYFKQMF